MAEAEAEVKVKGRPGWLVPVAVFAGAFLGGVVYHFMTCPSCRQARQHKDDLGSIDAVAHESAVLDGRGDLG